MDRARNDTPGTRECAAQAAGCETDGDQPASPVALSRQVPLDRAACSDVEAAMRFAGPARYVRRVSMSWSSESMEAERPALYARAHRMGPRRVRACCSTRSRSSRTELLDAVAAGRSVMASRAAGTLGGPA